MTNTGNINYSLKKNDVMKIISTSIVYFVPYYYVLIFISLLYIFTIRFKQFYFLDRKKEYRMEKETSHYFESLTNNIPFNILKLRKEEVSPLNNSNKSDNDKYNKYIGLSIGSYYLIIISYVITLFIILEGLIRNYIYSIYLNVIQINSNNNPYKNPDCIQKISENGFISTSKNYFSILSMSFVFFFPFIVPYIISFLNFDNFDLKKNKWFPYVVLFFIFYPILIVLMSKAAFHKKLEIFSNLYKYIDTKDYPLIDIIRDNFNFKIYTVIFFVLIAFIYSYYRLVYTDFKYRDSLLKKIIIYVFVFIIVFVFLPIFFIFFSLSLVFGNEQMNMDQNTIENINKYGIKNIYDLLVKYNYPCFIK